MAKSLRSKPKLRAKSVKRKGEFTKFVDDRNARLAEKTRLNLQKQTEEKMAEDTPAETIAEDAPKQVVSNRALKAKKLSKAKKSRNKKLKF